MMKYMVAAVAALMIGATAQAASLNLYGGVGGVSSSSLSQAGVVGGSAAALAGVSGTQAVAGTVSNGAATTRITPTGVRSTQRSATVSEGNTASGALGLAGAGSVFGAGGTSQSAAGGVFGTVGLGLLP